MARGRKPLIALSEAKHIAEKRGEVRHFRHEPDMILQFRDLHCRTRGARPDPARRAYPHHTGMAGAGSGRRSRNAPVSLHLRPKSPASSGSIRPKVRSGSSGSSANSFAELDRNGQLMPDQPPVPKRRTRPAAPATDGKTGDPESAPGSPGSVVRVPVFLLPAVTPESVDPPTVSDVRQVSRMSRVV